MIQITETGYKYIAETGNNCKWHAWMQPPQKQKRVANYIHVLYLEPDYCELQGTALANTKESLLNLPRLSVV